MKRLIKILIGISIGGGLYARSVGFVYAFGKNQDEVAHGVMETPDTQYIVVGEALLGGGGKTDAISIKLGFDGSFIWYKTYGGPNRDMLKFPFLSYDGNYLIFGSTKSTGFIETKKPVAIKTDISGNLLWTKIYNIVGEFSDVIFHSGEYIVVGKDVFRGGFISFLTADANLRFAKSYGVGELKAVAPDGSGGFVVVGEYNNDGWVMRLDNRGNVIWSKVYGGDDYDAFKDVIVVPPYAYIGGETKSAGAGDKDIWILKVDITDGSVIFSRTYGGSGEDEVRNLMLRGTVIGVLAKTKSFGFGGEDFWVFEIYFDGNLINSYTFGGTNNDNPQMGKTTADNAYILVGYTESFGRGGKDYFVVKLLPTMYACIESGRPTPLINNFFPSVLNLTVVGDSAIPGFVWAGWTTTSPSLDMEIVCSPLGSDQELQVNEVCQEKGVVVVEKGRVEVKSYGKGIKVYSIGGSLITEGRGHLITHLKRGVYYILVGNKRYRVIVR